MPSSFCGDVCLGVITCLLLAYSNGLWGQTRVVKKPSSTVTFAVQSKRNTSKCRQFDVHVAISVRPGPKGSLH